MLGVMTDNDVTAADRHITGTYAMVVPVAESRVISEDVYLSQLIEGAAKELGRVGKHLTVLLAATDEVYARTLDYLTSGHVDGVIITSLHSGDPLPQELKAAGVPVVTSGRSVEDFGIPFVDVDHKGASRNAVLYLFGTGRFNVATIAGPNDVVDGIDRLEGYLSAMSERDVEPIVAQGDFTRAAGVSGMKEILERGGKVDAVFCGSDLIAAGAIDAIGLAGLRVPEDIAVVGFDDITSAKHMNPPLTTVRQPIHELGSALAHQVYGLATGAQVNEGVVLPTELIVRASA